MQVELTVIKKQSQLDALAVTWQSLCAQDKHAVVFNDWHWNRLWWKYYGTRKQLHVLVFSSDQGIVAIAPLYRTIKFIYRLIPIHTLMWIGSGSDTTPEDLGFICHPLYRTAVRSSMLDYLGSQTSCALLLRDMSTNSTLFNQLQQRVQLTDGHSRHLDEVALRYSPLPDSWDKYLQTLSRNTRKQIKRRRNRIVLQTNARVQRCETINELDTYYDALVSLHHRRWRSKGVKGGFSASAYIKFHRDLIHALFQQSRLWLVAMFIDDQIVAVEYAFDDGQSLNFFQTGFDPKYAHLSPGHVLMAWMLEQAIEQGLRRVELLRGDYEYKQSYAAHTRYSSIIDHIPPGPGARVRALLDAIRPPAGI